MASINILAAAIVAAFVVSFTLALPELPPDVAPLFPSTGGAAYPPAGSIMPTIPSSRSPPNPDVTGLDAAFGPSGWLQDSSAVARAFPGFLTFGLVAVFFV